ncbi:acyclic terpene utilization AtuA family protein [Celeribacter halophilus]|uniref:acyclic terpene utilization AtuA family protein n=1 Tax=Celeribacter halophilus TaxID=576117 RepID=UPI003A8CFE00
MQNLFRIGCGAGFGGDRLDAAIPVVQSLIASGGPSCLMFETLAERTLALAQLARAAGGVGYDQHLMQRLRPILADCLQHGITIVGNFGAADPRGAAQAIAALAQELGARAPRIFVVTGDDLMVSPHRDKVVPILRDSLPPNTAPLSANTYLGAKEIHDALLAGADIVVTGRVADPALALGPAAAHFGWSFDDLDLIAAGTMAGHLLECGGQVTGGYFADPGRKDVLGLATLGFPIVEISEDGSLVVTKPANTGGCVTAATVKEQLLYEIHDPAAYLTPDVVLDLSHVRLDDQGHDRVALYGARGKPRPATLKATVCYDGGFLGEGSISYSGPNAEARARLAADILRDRLANKMEVRTSLVSTQSDLVPLANEDDGLQVAVSPPPFDKTVPSQRDVRLHIAVRSADRMQVEHAMHELGALYTCGPGGGGGVRSSIRSRVYTSSALIPRNLVQAACFEWEDEK